MSSIIDFNAVDKELLRVLRDQCNLDAELVVPPVSGKPYVVITPEVVTEDMTLFMLDSIRDATYRLEYVGEGATQIRWIQSKVHTHLIVNKAWDPSKGICGVIVTAVSPMRRDDEHTWVLPEIITVKVSA